MLSCSTSFSNPRPKKFENAIEIKETYLAGINTTKMIFGIVGGYVKSYISKGIDIALEPYVGNKLVLKVIKEGANYIMSKVEDYLESCIESYIQTLEKDKEMSTEYWDASKIDYKIYTSDENDSVIIGDDGL